VKMSRHTAPATLRPPATTGTVGHGLRGGRATRP
jgi:hypothetical protein